MKTPNRPPPELKAPAIRVGPFLLTSEDGKYWAFDVIPHIYQFSIQSSANDQFFACIRGSAGKSFTELDDACAWLEENLIRLYSNLKTLQIFGDGSQLQNTFLSLDGSRWKEGLPFR